MTCASTSSERGRPAQAGPPCRPPEIPLEANSAPAPSRGVCPAWQPAVGPAWDLPVSTSLMPHEESSIAWTQCSGLLGCHLSTTGRHCSIAVLFPTCRLAGSSYSWAGWAVATAWPQRCRALRLAGRSGAVLGAMDAGTGVKGAAGCTDWLGSAVGGECGARSCRAAQH